MDCVKVLKFFERDLDRIDLSLVDTLTTYSVKNEDGYVLKLQKKEESNFVGQKDFLEMLKELYELELIPKTEFAVCEIDGEIFYGFLQKRANFLSYPFEWSISMMKDVAVLILKLNKILNKYGYTLKDSHPFNVVFFDKGPLWVDIGSFSKINNYKDIAVFEAFEEFYTRIYKPLILASKGLYNLSQRLYGDIKSLSTYEMLLLDNFWFNRFIPRELFRKFIKYYFYYNSKFYCEERINKKISQMSNYNLMRHIYNLLKNMGFPLRVNYAKLENKLERMKISFPKSNWNEYYVNLSDYPKRFPIIADFIKKFNIRSITDIGGNLGLMGMFLLEKENYFLDKYICIDLDMAAIDKGYEISKSKKYKNMYFVNTNPFVPQHYAICSPIMERGKSVCVTALALFHHLLLSQNLDIDYCLKIASEYTTKYAFIEFMPMGLFDGINQPPPVPTYYTVDWFREKFQKYFTLIVQKEIDTNRILFIGAKR